VLAQRSSASWSWAAGACAALLCSVGVMDRVDLFLFLLYFFAFIILTDIHGADAVVAGRVMECFLNNSSIFRWYFT